MASVLDDITVLILTYNEARNIERTLDTLRWAERILVVDSFSTDATQEIIINCNRATLLQRDFDNHSNQWNYGLAHVESEWVLCLDADYQLTDPFVAELKGLGVDEGIDAYFVRFKYCINGRPLRATLYPPRAILFRRSRCRYEQSGHTQILRFEGNHGWLQSFVYHDDRKSLTAWLKAQDRYAQLEAKHLLANSAGDLNLPDRLRRWIFAAPPFVLLYTSFVKGLILDGWAGWYYTFQRTMAEILLSLRLIEAKLHPQQRSD